MFRVTYNDAQPADCLPACWTAEVSLFLISNIESDFEPGRLWSEDAPPLMDGEGGWVGGCKGSWGGGG